MTSSDEILNGKTHDRNSHVFAQYCFEHGIDLYVCPLPDSLGCPLHSANEGISENGLRWLLMKKTTCKHPLASGHAIGPHLLRSLEASRRLTEKYDFVVTSGGIGPTHDGQCATRLCGQSDIIH